MFEVSGKIKTEILKNKGLIVLVLVVLSLLIPSIFSPQITQADKKKEVLGITAKAVSQIPTPTVSIIPSPTIFIPTPTAAVPTSPTETPTLTPTPAPAAVATPTPTPTQTSVDTPTPSLTPTPTPSEILSPTPAGLSIQIGIDYAGQKAADSYTVSVAPGQTAWDAVVAAVGINNIQYTNSDQYGVFISGFNGIVASGNQYFEFMVNGVSSSVGVSSYQCNDGDKLDFVLTSF